MAQPFNNTCTHAHTHNTHIPRASRTRTTTHTCIPPRSWEPLGGPIKVQLDALLEETDRLLWDTVRAGILFAMFPFEGRILGVVINTSGAASTEERHAEWTAKFAETIQGATLTGTAASREAAIMSLYHL